MDITGSFLIILQITFLYVATIRCMEISDSQEKDLRTKENTTPRRDFRWSYFYFLENKCTKICKDNGKPFGRMQGGVCRCFCPIVAVDWTLCSGTTPSCDNFCRSLKFRLGGACIHDPDDCYCFCYPQDAYDRIKIEPPSDNPPNSTLPFPYNHVKPTYNHIINKITHAPQDIANALSQIIHKPNGTFVGNYTFQNPNGVTTPTEPNPDSDKTGNSTSSSSGENDSIEGIKVDTIVAAYNSTNIYNTTVYFGFSDSQPASTEILSSSNESESIILHNASTSAEQVSEENIQYNNEETDENDFDETGDFEQYDDEYEENEGDYIPLSRRGSLRNQN